MEIRKIQLSDTLSRENVRLVSSNGLFFCSFFNSQIIYSTRIWDDFPQQNKVMKAIRGVFRNLSRLNFFLSRGGLSTGAQYPLGHENPLKSIDFTGPGKGLSPNSPPPEYASEGHILVNFCVFFFCVKSSRVSNACRLKQAHELNLISDLISY